METASEICFSVLTQVTPRAVDRALVSAGISIDARIPMIAITTSSSISVNRLTDEPFMT